MSDHRVTAIVAGDKSLTLQELPFDQGQSVEVIVRPHVSSTADGKRYPLRGTPIRYEDPHEPVAATDWDAAS